MKPNDVLPSVIAGYQVTQQSFVLGGDNTAQIAQPNPQRWSIIISSSAPFQVSLTHNTDIAQGIQVGVAGGSGYLNLSVRNDAALAQSELWALGGLGQTITTIETVKL